MPKCEKTAKNKAWGTMDLVRELKVENDRITEQTTLS